MKKSILTITLAILMFTPLFVSAQNWSSDQKEVWSAIESWWDNSKANNTTALTSSIHSDYRGWSLDEAFPSTQKDLTYWVNNLMSKRKTLRTSLKPLDILVSGDMAVVHYLYSQINSVEDKEKTITGRWTDVWKRENGKWMLYADSGGEWSTDD